MLMNGNNELGQGSSRRDFVKKAAYVAPAILSLKATSALAANGSAPVRTRRDVEWDLKYWKNEKGRLKKLLEEKNRAERRQELKAAVEAAVARIKDLIEELKKFV